MAEYQQCSTGCGSLVQVGGECAVCAPEEGSALRDTENTLRQLLKAREGSRARLDAAPQPGVTRAKVLDFAGQAVLIDRAKTHGQDLEDSFAVIARYWTNLFGVVVEPWQVPLAMSLLKIARTNQNPKHLDNWVDQAGYAACGAEVAGA